MERYRWASGALSCPTWPSLASGLGEGGHSPHHLDSNQFTQSTLSLQCENNVKAHLKKNNASFHSFPIYSLLDMAAINIIMDSHFTMDFLERLTALHNSMQNSQATQLGEAEHSSPLAGCVDSEELCPTCKFLVKTRQANARWCL